MKQDPLTKNQLFFFLSFCLVANFHFQSSHKVDSDSFCHLICRFHGGTGFWSSLLYHFC